MEQHPETRKDRPGTAVLRLARICESTLLLIPPLQSIGNRLSGETGASGHVSLTSDACLTTIAPCKPNLSTRVRIDPTQVLAFHAKTSRTVYLANLPMDEAEARRRRISDQCHTAETATRKGLLQRMQEANRTADARAIGRLEVHRAGPAVPVFDWH